MHVGDPVFRSDALIQPLALSLAPRYRVVSLALRDSVPYQLWFDDLFGVLKQFGFGAPILIGERLGCLAALLVAAWCPSEVGGLVLIDPHYDPPAGDGLAAQALRDCPPDWPALRSAVHCRVLVTSASDVALTGDVEALLAATLP